MKYDDEELAEAALLLAHVEPRAMPRALRQKLAEQGSAMAAEVRFTTTKAAAVVGPAPEPLPARASSLRTWGGWFAAAACFAALVYQWRVHALLDARGVSVGAASTLQPVVAGADEPLAVRGPDGATLALVSWDAATREGRISPRGLAPNAAGEHYVLWVSTGDASLARAVGAFVCDGACADKAFGSTPLPSVSRVWLTRGPVDGGASALGDAAILGEAHRETR